MDKMVKSTVAMTAREHLELTGITEVISFDETFVELLGEDGRMSVEGSGLRIAEFDSANSKLTIDGRISAISYFDDPRQGKKGGLFGKLFS